MPPIPRNFASLDLYPQLTWWDADAEPDRDGPYVVEDGAIVDKLGGLLYDADTIADLSPAARQRLAEIHSLDVDLEWEGSLAENIWGAWDILIAEGLMPEEQPDANRV